MGYCNVSRMPSKEEEGERHEEKTQKEEKRTSSEELTVKNSVNMVGRTNRFHCRSVVLEDCREKRERREGR